MVLIVSSNILNAIHRHSMSAYPEECCGLLVGAFTDDGKDVQAAWRLENRSEDDPERRYLIPPDTYMKLEQRAEDEDREIVGIYHSHPDHPSQPSEFDRRHALPLFSYVITSVVDGQSEGLECWVLEPDRQSFLKEEIVVR